MFVELTCHNKKRNNHHTSCLIFVKKGTWKEDGRFSSHEICLLMFFHFSFYFMFLNKNINKQFKILKIIFIFASHENIFLEKLYKIFLNFHSCFWHYSQSLITIKGISISFNYYIMLWFFFVKSCQKILNTFLYKYIYLYIYCKYVAKILQFFLIKK